MDEDAFKAELIKAHYKEYGYDRKMPWRDLAKLMERLNCGPKTIAALMQIPMTRLWSYRNIGFLPAGVALPARQLARTLYGLPVPSAPLSMP